MSLRVLIAVTHLLGVGHLTRAASVGRAFARAGHEVTLVSGGMPAPLVSTEGLRFVQLAPVRVVGTNFSALLDEGRHPIAAERLTERRAALLRAFRETAPDVVITELFPFGRRVLAAEFMDLLREAAAASPRPLIAASVRDILVAPAKPERLREAHERLGEFYDAVLVHGDPAVLPLGASWALDPSLKSRIHSTGYVASEGAPEAASNEVRSGEILVSGGGSSASLPLYRAALAAARLIGDRPWRILVGGGVEEDDFRALGTLSAPNATVERARPDFRRLLRSAALSVSQAGYNTVTDVLQAGIRSVLVPFEAGQESEQRVRAEQFEARGLALMLSEAELSGAALAARVRAALSSPPPAKAAIDCDGADGTVRIVERLIQQGGFQQGGHAAAAVHTRSPGPGTWRTLRCALARATEAGHDLVFWWRDDDAVAHTSQLDRLLALANRLESPVAMAASPARLEASLGIRLGDEPLASVLVHGLSHANHAPFGSKKAEFGADRSLDRLRADAALALELARSALGARLDDVFVPPWNRIAPDLAGLLPQLGYRALSGFGTRPGDPKGPPIHRIDTHIDPVDWHGSRSLADPDRLVSHIASLLDAPPESRRPTQPIGLLTHHLAFDETLWAFCEELLGLLLTQPGTRLRSIGQLLDGMQPVPSNCDGGDEGRNHSPRKCFR